ncbi:replicative DNA helicase [Deferribacter abyssi]|uniref:replicative DNA helicase n=1 Tax=Deferribacter abyssi TaxID=213806 RepID=UPI003C18E326
MSVKTKNRVFDQVAEDAVIASILVEPKSLLKIYGYLSPSDFYNPSAREVFKACLSLKAEGKAIDIVTVNEKTENKYLDYIASVSDILATGIQIKEYAKIVKKYANYRRFQEALDRAKEILPDELEDKLTKVVGYLRDIATSEAQDFVFKFSDVKDEILEQIHKIRAGQIIGYKTGIYSIDSLFLGIQSGLYIVAGRPHMGKTTFSLRLAIQLARNGCRVLYCPLEDPNEAVMKKNIALLMGMDLRGLYKTKYAKAELDEAVREFEKLPIKFAWRKFTAKQLRYYVEAYREDFDCVFIDQLSHIIPEDEKDQLRIQLNKSIREIKSMSKELKMPVFLLSQINRSVEHRQEKRPLLSDLKETGNLEEDADVIMLLYRDEYYNKNSKYKDILEVNIAKNKLTDEKTTLYFKEQDKRLVSVTIDGQVVPEPEEDTDDVGF